MRRAGFPLIFAGVTAILVALAWVRPVNHDESQYVAAAALVARGLLPYSDFAYLQTPLQPLLFAPVAGVAGAFAWPALRMLNALCAAVALGAVFVAARVGGASERSALAAAGLFATADIFLFAAGAARNDALPSMLLSLALVPVVRAARRGEATRGGALLAGALLAGAAAAKVSYAVPAAAFGAVALLDRRSRPAFVLLGALPAVVLVAGLAAAAPAAFRFDVLDFPAYAPSQYYQAEGRAWKLAPWARMLDFVVFLALGPALLACIEALRVRWRGPRALDALLIAGAVAALLPAPTFRQYLLPMLPPLFVRLAIAWTLRPPGRAVRIAGVVFAGVGLVPTILGFAEHRLGMSGALRVAADARAALRRLPAGALVATTSPQFVPARHLDARFAAGPFYLRSAALLDAADERRFRLVSAERLATLGPVAAVVTGAERWSAGDVDVDAALDRWAAVRGYRAQSLAKGRLRLWLRPSGPASAPPDPRNRP